MASKKHKKRLCPDLERLKQRRLHAPSRFDAFHVEQAKLAKVILKRTGLTVHDFYQGLRGIVAQGETQFQPLLDSVQHLGTDGQKSLALANRILDEISLHFPKLTKLVQLSPEEINEILAVPAVGKPPQAGNSAWSTAKPSWRVAAGLLGAMALGWGGHGR